MRRILLLAIAATLLSLPVFAQQTGTVTGEVTMEDGEPLPGVTITASSEVLPQPRIVVSNALGSYRFPALAPGRYELTYVLDGMATQKQSLEVLLDQTHNVNAVMVGGTVEDTISVVAESAPIDLSSTELKAAISEDTIEALPLGQEYRDLVKLAPGVQYTEDATRGPSVGGSGQDNVYRFDGVSVALPLFGTLASEPASYDVEQISFLKGGAKAIDFNRSGGFTINTISRSGTSQWKGQVGYQLQSSGMTADLKTPEGTEKFEDDLDWINLGAGGPIIQDQLYFYGSFYRPEVTRTNRENVYGAVPDFESTRDELFGKLTWAPTSTMLFNASYRDSDREGKGETICDTCSAENSASSDSQQQIANVEGSWMINDRSSLSFKYSDFDLETFGGPDHLLGFDIGPGVNLDVNNLDQQGQFSVPLTRDDQPDFNAGAEELINRYGYLGDDGTAQGGGIVGPEDQINNQDFFNENFQIFYDYYLPNHELHFGYLTSEVTEDLDRLSNGWGRISDIGGLDGTADGRTVFYESRFWQQSLGDVPSIVSSMESESFEINDTIRLDEWTFNVGVLFSNDTYFGSGLRKTGQGVSGFEVAPGHKYKMYEIDFDDMIQPRLGATWSWNQKDSAYANYARYHPAASSLPRAASWDRNLRREIDAQFDGDGNLIGFDPVRSSSGKWFQDGIEPRYVDEYLVGYSKQISNQWTGRAHFRHRRGEHFWEDTNNDARSRFEPPPGIPTDDYVPNLQDIRDEIGGSSYVIAELDGAFTRYYEASLEGEYRSAKSYMRGTFVWSHYYGNFDQDNTTTGNDANIFIGSSFLADGAGRQIWNFRDGDLRGDRRYQLKAYGYHGFDFGGSVGAFFVFQDGQPWEAWDVEVYRHLTGSSSDTSRYGEPAGSRRTDDHYQLDLNYSHRFELGGRYGVVLRADLFNVFDEQTGHNIQNKVNSANFGVPRTFFNPQRLQLALRFEF